MHTRRRNGLSVVECVHVFPEEMERDDVNSDEEASDGLVTRKSMLPQAPFSNAVGAQDDEDEFVIFDSQLED